MTSCASVALTYFRRRTITVDQLTMTDPPTLLLLLYKCTLATADQMSCYATVAFSFRFSGNFESGQSVLVADSVQARKKLRCWIGVELSKVKSAK